MDEINGIPRIKEEQKIRISNSREKKVGEFIGEFVLEFKKTHRAMLIDIAKTRVSISESGYTAKVHEIKSQIIKLLKLEITRGLVSKMQKSNPSLARDFLRKFFSHYPAAAVEFTNRFATDLYQDKPNKKIADTLKNYILDQANKDISFALKKTERGKFERFKETLMENIRVRFFPKPVQLPDYAKFENYLMETIIEIKQSMEETKSSSVFKSPEKKCAYYLDQILKRDTKAKPNLSGFLRYALKNKAIKNALINGIADNLGIIQEDAWARGFIKKLLSDVPEFRSHYMKKSIEYDERKYKAKNKMEQKRQEVYYKSKMPRKRYNTDSRAAVPRAKAGPAREMPEAEVPGYPREIIKVKPAKARMPKIK